MTELRRILCNRRRSMILLALPLLCLGLFLVNAVTAFPSQCVNVKRSIVCSMVEVISQELHMIFYPMVFAQ